MTMALNPFKNWPTSLPDYQWPARYRSAGYFAARWLLAAAFHVAHAIGLIMRVLRRARPAALVIRTDGIGDAILFEPALETLARSLSPHEIHLWAPEATCEILRACPVIRRRFAIPRGFRDGNLLVFRSLRWRARMGYLFGRYKFEVAVYPAESPEPLGNWIFTSVRARARWINAGDTLNQFEQQRNKTHARATRILSNRPGTAHELLRNAYLSSQWGGSLELRTPKLSFNAQAIDQAQRQLAEWERIERHVRASGIAGIIPAGSQVINRYPAAKWRAVIGQLWHEQRVLCAIIAPDEYSPFVNEIVTGLGDVPVARLTRWMNISATAALVARLDALIAMDTGLAHAAVAQDTPTIVLRIGGDPGRFFPWPGATKSIVLSKPMPCEGCHNRCTLAEAECVTQIEPADVVAAYAKLCGTARARIAPAAPAAKWLKVAG
jgi:ADP-heptose:LPS heptosyltransferase